MSNAKIRPFVGCSDLREVIKVGDQVKYASTGEARTIEELTRSPSATVEATGRVLAVYSSYVLLELPKGVRECANRGTIIGVISSC